MRYIFPLLLIALAGCQENNSSLPAPEPTPPTPTGEPNLRLLEVASGLSQPLYLTHAGDGSGDLYVVEKGGRIRLIQGGSLRSQAVLDLSGKISTGSEQGLLGLAFHPNFRNNGYLYVNYTNTAGDTIIARYTMNRSTKVADPNSEQVVLTVDQPYANHNAGWLGFGPDGMLYIPLGDGGSGGDPQNHAQRLEAQSGNRHLLGKVVRIDVNATESGRNYRIPSDNPTLGGRVSEIWAYGLRNPWRASFDRATGDLWLGDVGEGAMEEVSLGPKGGKGLNYGWRIMEGTRCNDNSISPGCNHPSLTPPVHAYGRGDGYSVTGGYVYRGERFPRMRGRYFFTDFGTGHLWSLRQVNGAWQRKTELPSLGTGLASFGEDEQGELYLVNLLSGKVWRIEDQP
ncbi:Quinoprotein glucose dehydrogenase B [Meiothermus luteus]|jgi:glucose/arabinose dehydrogenase|uniref:Quinoprotein glucose dehydrogenase B n=1 Tax=Meiothermus luteus TaxID=2026184 RepID=A0A399EFX3_9DEIN|nr:PQQ-dependent sugar dehydrogenase [Meiothermus luteus]RIH83547.1 Quinoprotein glucose dehydrogenase B [Meiothermus luteus]RMH53356.1 MAG: glucose dehydrogenase [Deinococcota bacterium]